MSRLDEIRARCLMASPGPWREWRDSGTIFQALAPKPVALKVSAKDVNFIIHAREDIPYLLSEVERLTVALAQYREAEEEGLLVRLPCWGNVYIVQNGQVQEMKMTRYSGRGTGVYAMMCECVEQFEDCGAICHNEDDKACGYNFRVAEIGKTVFLTHAEAEQALKGDKQDV